MTAIVDRDTTIRGVWVADPATGLASTVGTAATPTVVSPASGSTFTTSPNALSAGTDRSGQITTGGTAQVLAAANASRVALEGMNISAEDMWINEIGGTATPNTAGSYKVASFQTFSVLTNRAISIVAATTASKFTATEV